MLYEYRLETPKEGFIDITDEVRDACRQSGVFDGMMTVYVIFPCQHQRYGTVVDVGGKGNYFFVFPAHRTFGTSEKIKGTTEGFRALVQHGSPHLHICVCTSAALTDKVIHIYGSAAVSEIKDSHIGS